MFRCLKNITYNAYVVYLDDLYDRKQNETEEEARNIYYQKVKDLIFKKYDKKVIFEGIVLLDMYRRFEDLRPKFLERAIAVLGTSNLKSLVNHIKRKRKDQLTIWNNILINVDTQLVLKKLSKDIKAQKSSK